MTVQRAIGNFLFDPADQVIPQEKLSGSLLVKGAHRPLHCRLQSDNRRHIFRSRTPVPLLRTAVDKRLQLQSRSDVEEADALWPVDLMTAGAQHIDVHLVHVDRQLSECLHGIGVKGDTMSLCHRAERSNRLHRSDLIVCKHDAHQYRIGTYGSLQRLRADQPVPVHLEVGDVKAPLFQIFTGMKYGVVFNPRRDDMSAFFTVCLGSRLQGPVVGLRPARRKINILPLRAERRCNRALCPVHRALRRRAERINRAGISVC